MMLRSSRKQAKDVSLYEPIGADKEGNEICLIDLCMAPEQDILGELALREDIGKLSSFLKECLTERERKIIVLRYGLAGGPELTQRELAEYLNISRSYVSRIEKRALMKLRECYENDKNIAYQHHK